MYRENTHSGMANASTTTTAGQSSRGASHCFIQCPVHPTNRKRKVVEPSSYKPQLSLLRDRDKLLLPCQRVPVVEQGGTELPPKCRKELLLQFESNPSCCTSISPLALREKTNGYPSGANNCPMALLKYFCSLALYFFKRLFPWTSCPCLFFASAHQCHFWSCINQTKCNGKNKPFSSSMRELTRAAATSYTNNNYKNDKKFPSTIIFLSVCFLFLAKFIHVGSATPLSSIPTPTQTTIIDNMAYSGGTETKYSERLDKKRPGGNNNNLQAEKDGEHRHHHHQLSAINNTTFDGGGAGFDDEVKEMKNEMNGIGVNTEKVHSRGRNLYSDSIKNDSKSKSGNHVEFTSPSAASVFLELPNNSNNKNKTELGGKKEKKLFTMVPLAVRTGPVVLPSSSSSSLPVVVASTSKQQEQHDAASTLETNDVSGEMKESRSKNNGDDESSFILINNNNNDNSNSKSVSAATKATFALGKCWPISVERTEENETERGSSSPSTASDPFSTPVTAQENPIGLVCNGTNHLAITLSQIPENFVHQVISIVVQDSLISTLNLSLFYRFSRLESVSVTHSNITEIIGTCPLGLKALNVSFNNISKLSGSIFFTKAASQRSEYDYEDVGAAAAADDEETVASSNNNNDSDNNIATNFSTEMISAYLASSAAAAAEQQQNKSDPKSELLSLSPPSSSLPSTEKISATSSRFKTTGYYYSEKLMGQPFASTRKKKITSIPFLTNREGKLNELGEEDSSLLGISTDHYHHHLHPQKDGLMNNASKTSQKASAAAAAAEVKAVFLETLETNEDSAVDDSDVHFNYDDDDDDGAVSSTAYRETQANTSAGKMAGKADSNKTYGADSFAAAADNEEVVNADCGFENGLCKSVRIGKKRRDVTQDVSDDNDYRHSQRRRDNESRNAGNLNSAGYINKLDEDVASSGSNKEHEYRYYHHRRSSTPPSSRESDMSRNIFNKWENERKVAKKPSPLPLVFSTKAKGTSSGGGGGTVIKRKARSTATTTTTSSTTTGLSLEDIDLSHNNISELPRALLQLESLKSLRLSGNQLKRDFVWEKLADWYMHSQDPNILKDGDETFCRVVDDVRVFQFTVLGVLKAKKDLVETCRTVDKNICHECGLYALNKQPGYGYKLSHQSPHGSVAIALKLDCSYRNLSDLPTVPPQTWQLNVSGNSIKDLIPLKEPMYENLLILDADSNEISTLDGLAGTSFLDKYNYLSLQNNQLSVIPSNILTSLKNMRGQGVTQLGANFIECDCDTVKDIKPLLLENSKKIKDLKEIYCKDMKTRTGESFMAVKDLQYTDLCYLDSEESNEMYLYLIILIELLLIFVIVAKVWHDQRTFRRTGILPWCSAKMPRLPCDAMLESVKEPPHFNRSSSTNVRSYACEPPATQSISSCVQLREVRSNSGQSEKSSQISQLSSFPGSSRTSSV